MQSYGIVVFRADVVFLNLFALAFFLVSFCATADTIFFDLKEDGKSITMTQRGDGTAFYPHVFFLGAHGDWQVLAAPPSISQLAKGDSMRMDWRPASNIHPSRALQIRYFDRAGASFGQLTFLANWPGLNTPFATRRESERLLLEATGNEVSSTWVLWAADEDERPSPNFNNPTRSPLPPLHLQWNGSSGNSRSLSYGAGQIVLLHELSAGTKRYATQYLPAMPVASSPFRPAWLDFGERYYAAALFALIAFGVYVFIGKFYAVP